MLFFLNLFVVYFSALVVVPSDKELTNFTEKQYVYLTIKLALVYLLFYTAMRWLYGFLFYSKLQGTLGHRIMRVKVVDKDGNPLDGVQGGNREVLKILPYLVVYVINMIIVLLSIDKIIASKAAELNTTSDTFFAIATFIYLSLAFSIFITFILWYLWLLWDRNKQNLYDKIINSYVVKYEDSVRMFRQNVYTNNI